MVQRVDAVNRPPRRIRYAWPLHPMEWDSVPADIWESNQWQSRPLGHASRASIPTMTGVYMMCVRLPHASMKVEPFSTLMEVIYVGKSKNLRRRYAEHLNTPSPKVRQARMTYSDSLRFWFLNLPADRIAATEGDLIRCFGPPANDQPGEAPQLTIGSPNRAQSHTRKED